MRRLLRPAWIERAQGAYFFLTGIWPLLDIDSFQRVTGPKLELWLVRTVGALIAVIGCTLLVAGLRSHRDSSAHVLGIGSAGALLLVDVSYVDLGVISPIYLLDAVAEMVLIAWWVAALARRPSVA